MPGEKLPDLTMRAPAAPAAAMAASSASEQPVVPMMWTSPRSAAARASATLAAGAVKSMTASALASTAATSSVTVTPMGSSPATVPASRPMTSAPGRSSAPARVSPGWAAMALILAWPMRPLAPATTVLKSGIGSSPRLLRL